MNLYRSIGLFVLGCLFATSLASESFGQTSVSFPWGCDSGKAKAPAPVGDLPVYRTLSKTEGHKVTPQPVVLQPLPPQQAYAYGWFGSNSTPIWGRHFGVNKSYTQWTER